MAIKNTSVVYINGINLTSYAVFPIKWGNFLDVGYAIILTKKKHGSHRAFSNRVSHFSFSVL